MSELNHWRTDVQVRSFSQLKYDLRDVNTFVLEPDDDDPLVRRRTRSLHGVQSLEEPDGEEDARSVHSAKVLSRSESAPSLEGGSPSTGFALEHAWPARVVYAAGVA